MCGDAGRQRGCEFDKVIRDEVVKMFRARASIDDNGRVAAQFDSGGSGR
jgi:hypothetical protein